VTQESVKKVAKRYQLVEPILAEIGPVLSIAPGAWFHLLADDRVPRSSYCRGRQLYELWQQKVREACEEQ
jgi:hypothetical protein